MLIFPIVNKGKILNVRVSLKHAQKIREKVNLENILASDINVNGKNFSTVALYENKEKNILKFIRENSVYQRDFFVATKFYRNSEFYDLYEVGLPPKMVCDEADTLFIKAILDIEKETPEVISSRYLAFDRIGFDKVYSLERMVLLRRIVKENEASRWEEAFLEYGVLDMVRSLGFLDIFQFTIIKEATIDEETIKSMIKSFSKFNSKDTKNIKRYYEIALDNKDIYDRMIYVSRVALGKDLALIKSDKED